MLTDNILNYSFFFNLIFFLKEYFCISTICSFMKNNNYFSYILILLGGSIAVYANAETEQDILILVPGIIFLMLGVYRLNTKLTSKPLKNSFEVRDEEE